MGPFADTYCPDFTDEQMTLFERMLEVPDPDLYGWIVGANDPPPEFAGELMTLLRAFQPHKSRDQNGG